MCLLPEEAQAMTGYPRREENACSVCSGQHEKLVAGLKLSWLGDLRYH